MKRPVAPRPGLRARPGLVALLTAAVLMAVTVPASALTAHQSGGAQHARPAAVITPVVAPVMSCSALTGQSFTGVPDAPGTVTSATVITEKNLATPVKFCDVRGEFAPQTKFHMLLPVSTWHGQYVQEGCSLLCGTTKVSDYPDTGYTCPAAYTGELAVGLDDMGHTASLADGKWAQNSLLLRIVFGLTSENSLDQMAKAIMTAYYGQPPAYSYYDGCSTGGREALMLAQRYPDDFNGIIAGSPAMNMAPLSALFATWLVRANTAPDGHQIVTSANIPALHAAVIQACGNAKGLITDPRQCAFNPASIQCPQGTHAASCLTPAQVTAVRKFYRGPTDPQGQSLYNGGEPYGSELGWVGEFVMPASDRGAPANSPEAQVALNYLKYMAFLPNPPKNFTLADVPFTAQEFYRVDQLGNLLYNANDPDLRAFAAHGGKLIMYHGWADQLIPPWSTLDYYAAVERAAGGYQASQSFSRLYMVPGGYHCLFGPDYTTANLADFLGALIGWVQGGTPPQAMPADTVVIATNKIIQRQTIRPYNALAPVTPAKGSLNGHYDYIGSY
jgi:pimeloyl-ACP methyl ester carboxylesterase